MSLDEARALMADPHANRMVQYKPHYGRTEYGMVVSVNDYWVFVVYSDSWQPKATAPEDLTVVAE